MKVPIALLGAALVGALAALCALVLPTAALETLVMGSGLPAIIAAAEPPLGFTARVCLALGAGGFFGIMAGLTLFVLVGTKLIDLPVARPVPQPDMPRAPVLRRADAHPDAPPRPPLMAARDMGTPFLEVGAGDIPKPLPLTPRVPIEAAVERPLSKVVADSDVPPLALKPVAAKPDLVEQALPDDLDQPLAAFDPQAVPRVPLPPPVLPPVKPKPEPVAERIAEVPLTAPDLPPLTAKPEPAAERIVAVPLFTSDVTPSKPVAADMVAEVPITAPPERFEVFEVTPHQRQAPGPLPAYPFGVEARPIGADDALARPETEASVHALLDRLERGAIRRGLQNQAAMPKPEPRLARGEDGGLEDTLASLRRMARRA